MPPLQPRHLTAFVSMALVVIASGCDDTRSVETRSAVASAWAPQGSDDLVRLVPTQEADDFGSAVAADDLTLVIGADSADGDVYQSGKAFVFDVVGDAWTQRAELTSSDPHGGSEFGRVVDIDGNTLIVSAPHDPVNGHSTAGSVYVFERDVGGAGGPWSQTARLVSPSPAYAHRFGFDAAISSETIAILEQDTLHVFESFNGGWSLAFSYLFPGGAEPGTYVRSVAIDGDTIVVGKVAHPNSTHHGGAYVFTRAGSWARTTVLTASVGEAAEFGNDVALDGQTLVVGTPTDGAAFVFTGGGSSWSERARLLPSSPEAVDFGISVALRGDRIAIGARGDRAFAFQGTGSDWNEVASCEGQQSGLFGRYVAVADDFTVYSAHLDDEVYVDGPPGVGGAETGGGDSGDSDPSGTDSGDSDSDSGDAGSDGSGGGGGVTSGGDGESSAGGATGDDGGPDPDGTSPADTDGAQAQAGDGGCRMGDPGSPKTWWLWTLLVLGWRARPRLVSRRFTGELGPATPPAPRR